MMAVDGVDSASRGPDRGAGFPGAVDAHSPVRQTIPTRPLASKGAERHRAAGHSQEDRTVSPRCPPPYPHPAGQYRSACGPQ